jgi:hypothetical protein
VKKAEEEPARLQKPAEEAVKKAEGVAASGEKPADQDLVPVKKAPEEIAPEKDTRPSKNDQKDDTGSEDKRTAKTKQSGSEDNDDTVVGKRKRGDGTGSDEGNRRKDSSGELGISHRNPAYRRLEQRSAISKVAGLLVVISLCAGVLIVTGGYYYGQTRKNAHPEIAQADKPLLDMEEFL